MHRPVVLDTGRLVAILRAQDENHARCVETLQDIAKPLYVCWLVITEAAWLLRNQAGGLNRLFDFLQSHAAAVVELDAAAVPWIGAFLQRYASAKAQLADAAVMYLTERTGAGAVLTLDRRGFSIDRLSDERAVRILPER